MLVTMQALIGRLLWHQLCITAVHVMTAGECCLAEFLSWVYV